MNAWTSLRTILPIAVLLTAGCTANRAPTTARATEAPQGFQSSEIFLVSSEFRGPVLVVYGQAGASPGEERPGNVVVYSVPGNGILITSRPEPRLGTPVRVAFGHAPSSFLRAFDGCDDMRRALTNQEKNFGVCWLDELTGTGIADHLAFLVTDWSHIPMDYNRGMFVVDSLLFHGRLKGGGKWTEPKTVPASLRKSKAAMP